jgi:hypothetical protein
MGVVSSFNQVPKFNHTNVDSLILMPQGQTGGLWSEPFPLWCLTLHITIFLWLYNLSLVNLFLFSSSIFSSWRNFPEYQPLFYWYLVFNFLLGVTA